MTVSKVPLLDLHAGGFVEADFHDRVDAAFARRADDAWTTYRAQAEASARARGEKFDAPEDAHWVWEKKVSATSRLLSYGAVGIEYEAQIQGLMLYKSDGEFARLGEQKGRPLVYVWFLASAPWNLEAVTKQPKFAGVGTVMIRAAIQVSLELDFKGRIGLHSLPRAEAWYDRRGFTAVGIDPTKQHMKYYEMTEAQAAKFIS